MSKKVGKVSQIIGPVVDVTFDSTNTELPKIYDSLEIAKDDRYNEENWKELGIGESELIDSNNIRCENEKGE